MSRALNDLQPAFRSKAMEFLARCCEAGVPCMIVQTLRSSEEQALDLARGASWVVHSKHQDGLAMDVAPYEVFQLHGPDKLQWNSDDPSFDMIGRIAKLCGLVWGGDWKKRDSGHVEMPNGPQEIPT